MDEWRGRCDWCDWPLAETIEGGCVDGNCSRRPMPKLGDVGELKQQARKAEADVERLRGLLPESEADDQIVDAIISKRQSGLGTKSLAEIQAEVERLRGLLNEAIPYVDSVVRNFDGIDFHAEAVKQASGLLAKIEASEEEGR